MKYEYYPCRKLINLLLIEHRNKPWKVNQKMQYKQYLPQAKKYIIDWINDNLNRPVALMMTEVAKNIPRPKILESRYKKLNLDIWKILEDPFIRELVELDLLFGFSTKEICKRLNDKLKPRVIAMIAIEQFRYYFWNLEEDDGVFRPTHVLKLIDSSRELSKAYSHVLKYFPDQNGLIRYEYFYHLNNSDEPNLNYINKILNLASLGTLEAFEKSDYDRIGTLSEILKKNAEVLKILKTLQNSSDIKDLSTMFKIKDELHDS